MVDSKEKKPAAAKNPVNVEAKDKIKKPAPTKDIAKSSDVVKTEAKEPAQKAAPAEKPQKVEVAAKTNKGMISIKQIGSPIRRDPRQRLYLKSLGLGKMNRVRQVVDNASTRGLLDKLRHMVVVVEQ
jgi:large subunit ribosomal protein L30